MTTYSKDQIRNLIEKDLFHDSATFSSLTMGEKSNDKAVDMLDDTDNLRRLEKVPADVKWTKISHAPYNYFIPVNKVKAYIHDFFDNNDGSLDPSYLQYAVVTHKDRYPTYINKENVFTIAIAKA